LNIDPNTSFNHLLTHLFMKQGNLFCFVCHVEISQTTTFHVTLLISLESSRCHGLRYFGILWAMSCPRIFWDTFDNIMA
jgi:hypothetical protein